MRAELLDLGSGTGRSLRGAVGRFGMSGIGIDRDPRKVREAQRAGVPVFEGDIGDLDPEMFRQVRVVCLDNVLEHLPSLIEVRRVLSFATAVAGDGIHIRHPSFESVDYLSNLDLKQYWVDWRGHTCPIRLSDFEEIFAELGLAMVTKPVRRAVDSGDSTILPLDAPPDTRHYDANLHGDKPDISFDRDVWYAYDIQVATNGRQPSIEYDGSTDRDARPPRVSFVGRPPTPRGARYHARRFRLAGEMRRVAARGRPWS